MSAARERGRPVQFHGVPLEERAFDSQGNRLPWALERYTDSTSRSSKRQSDEKGAFGKNPGRRSTPARSTRTQTPAKKDNPTLDGFEAALKFDLQHDAQLRQANAGAADSNHQHTLSVAKDPTQVVLYGYSPDTQWAALTFYENASGGMICEDYDREPPMERRRLHTGMEQAATVARRELTAEERTLAMRYSGGRCWIKVTFDTKKAAERAIASSPHPLQGHWVYAQPFKGHGPEADEPIPVRDEDREQGLLGAARPTSKAQTIGGTTGQVVKQVLTRGSKTLPRNTLIRSPELEDPFGAAEDISVTTTASSATATLDESAGEVRYRGSAPELEEAEEPAEPPPTTSKNFPEMQRTVLRPATEALLPQLSWSERIIRSLREGGWLPTDIIGTVVPRMENGDFDWNNASFYWKVFYWIDSTFGTDLCGMKEA